MKAQRVLLATSVTESWTVVDAEFVTVDSAERYLAHLTAIERSPNTVRAYAHSLALWLEFLRLRSVGWATAAAEDVSGFETWLRAPAANVIVFDASAARRAESTGTIPGRSRQARHPTLGGHRRAPASPSP